MKKRWAYAIQIALLLVMISGLITGCEGLSSAPPASEYPADIIGRVTVAGFLQNLSEHSRGVMYPEENNIFWVVDISVKNKTYPQPITREVYWQDWVITTGGIVYHPPELFKLLYPPPEEGVPVGQTGQLLSCFEVPSSLTLSNAQIVYQGQQPYSYGQLTGGDKVAGYDFLLKKVVQEAKGKVPATKIATVLSIQTSMVRLDSLYVELQPTSSALADKIYVVDLYENGRLRASGQVSWNQPQLNVFKKKMVFFSLTTDEYRAYHLEDISHIFTAVVHE